MQNKINILGAGISGMSCAIILAKNGFKVNIYESKNSVGARFNEDWQGIENWSEKIDVLDEIISYGIDINFKFRPLNKITLHYKNKKQVISDSVPLGYLVQKGTSTNSLESSLLRQCNKLGVKIKFNYKKERLSGIKMHINATGPKKISGLVKGVKFKSKLKNSYHFAVGNNLAKDFYSYLFIVGGEGTIATVFNKKFSNNSEKYLQNTIDYFKEYIDIEEVQKGRIFGGYGHFQIKRELRDKNSAILIGEAGGFQDYLFGFGMRYAFKSAHYAAKSIIDNENYEGLIKRYLKPKMAKSLINRKIYEVLGELSHYLFYLVLSKSKHPVKVLRRIY